MNNLTKADILAVNGKEGVAFNGVILVKDCNAKRTKNNKPYYDGLLQADETIPYKIWDNSEAFLRVSAFDYSNTVCAVSGTTNVYQGQTSIIIDRIEAIEGVGIENFMPRPYNVDAYGEALISQCKSSLSPEGFDLATKMLFGVPERWNAFKKEFAAKSHHDNCYGGLLAHTYKVVALMNWMLSMYEGLTWDENGVPSTAKKDLYILGALLHDIGKLDEMNFGVYQPTSFVTHRILGLDYLYEQKDYIVRVYGEKWFRYFQSVIVQHHGEFGDACRTVVAYVVHLADVLDSSATLVAQFIKSANAGGGDKFETDKINVNGAYLTF